MASLRDIRNRINSVKNTQQVTRAMKMVAAAKLRRAQERIFQTRPYAFTVHSLLTRLRTQADPSDHPLFERRDERRRALLIIVTADRGLAGAFNTNVIKTAEEEIEANFSDRRRRGDLFLMCIGRRGRDHFAKRGYQLVGDYAGVFDHLTFAVARDAATMATEGYLEGRWDEVKLVYNEFKNTISQNRVVEPFLPVPTEEFLTPVMEEQVTLSDRATTGSVELIYEPDAQTILKALIPRYLNYQLWRILLESNAAEQGARMVAMDNATSNAQELLRDLTLKYNRARQSAITTEIIEITSGANALEAS
ncbi:MAG: ATP synthase F1 subunit gamma [Rhodothermales bacterium]